MNEAPSNTDQRRYGDVRRRFGRFASRHGMTFALGSVVLATLAFVRGRDLFAPSQWALGYLLLVLLVANVSGARPALAAALSSFFAWNYFFLRPYHTFEIADPKDLTTLIVYLVVAVVIGLRTATLRAREAEALARESDAGLLLGLSEGLLSLDSEVEMSSLLQASIDEALQPEEQALFLAGARGTLEAVWKGTPSDDRVAIAAVAEQVRREVRAIGLMPSDLDDEARPAEEARTVATPGREDRLFVPLHGPSQVFGVVYVGPQRAGVRYSRQQRRILAAIANTASSFLEQQHLREEATQADALREADRLKSVFVSSVSHELKTPLTSANMTITGLLEEDVSPSPEHVREELTAVQQDLGRLDSSIADLLDLSRLESEAWRFEPELCEIGDVIGTALARLPAALKKRVKLEVPEELPLVRADFDQLVRALHNLLVNAYEHGQGGEVEVGARMLGGSLLVWVRDTGPGVPVEDRERIFDKFYRGERARQAASSTGLGLAITREIVHAHGGKVWVEDASPHGARFVIALPANAPVDAEPIR